jgi:GAF domain-containing protein
VFEAIARSASHLCGGEYAIVNRVNGNRLSLVAQHNERPGTSEETARAWPRPLDRTRSIAARAIIDRKVENIRDLNDEDLTPEIRDFHERIGARSLLAAPIMHDEQPIGVIAVSRSTPGEFPARQVDLLRTFASQAAIAIENARLFEAEQTRTKELTESLEYQTATSEVLGVIARVPGDIQSVLDAVAEKAARVCGAAETRIFRVSDGRIVRAARFGIRRPRPEDHGIDSGLPLSRGSVNGRAILERRTVHVADLAALTATEYPDAAAVQRVAGHRAIVATPLLRDGQAIGSITL